MVKVRVVQHFTAFGKDFAKDDVITAAAFKGWPKEAVKNRFTNGFLEYETDAEDPVLSETAENTVNAVGDGADDDAASGVVTGSAGTGFSLP